MTAVYPRSWGITGNWSDPFVPIVDPPYRYIPRVEPASSGPLEIDSWSLTASRASRASVPADKQMAEIAPNVPNKMSRSGGAAAPLFRIDASPAIAQPRAPANNSDSNGELVDGSLPIYRPEDWA
jgi:hypothetical protein